MTDAKEFDTVVIGAGPGGYPAAITLAQKGQSVALIEAKELGGTCLNRGCIPTKTLIANAGVWQTIQHASDFGIALNDASFDYSYMSNRKDKVVDKIRGGLGMLLKANGIEVIQGHAKIEDSHTVKVTGKSSQRIHTQNIILATGSEPKNIPAFPFDHEHIHDSTSLLNLKEVPKKLVIIGAGVIGSEFASLFNLLGTEVVLLEALSSIIPAECAAVSKALTRAFKQKNIAIHTDVRVSSVARQGSEVVVSLESGENIQADHCLVSIGRSLNTNKVGLEEAGVHVLENGVIPVNEYLQTNIPNIFAIGDITGKAMLAHVASHQGITATQNILGSPQKMHYNAIPSVVYTDPEVATVGLSVEDANEQNIPVTTGQFPFSALGKSEASGHTEGFAQVIVHQQTQAILGAQVVGFEAGSLITQMASAISNELTLECITDTVHPHPTIAEAWLEAALMAQGTPLHLPPKKRRPKKQTAGVKHD